MIRELACDEINLVAGGDCTWDPCDQTLTCDGGGGGGGFVGDSGGGCAGTVLLGIVGGAIAGASGGPVGAILGALGGDIAAGGLTCMPAPLNPGTPMGM